MASRSIVPLAPGIAAGTALGISDVLAKLVLASGAGVLSMLSFRSVIGLAFVATWLSFGPKPKAEARVRWISMGIGIVFAGRVARAGLWIGTSGIVVRGPFKTCSVSLDDAEGFGPGLQGRGGNGVPCPMLTRRDGPAVGVWALGRRNIWFRYRHICQEIEPLCGELNELVGWIRTAGPSR